MIATQALAQGVQALKAAGIDGAARDARRLMAHALAVPPDRLTLMLQDPLSADQHARFDAAIAQRCSHKPVAQITGRRLFWGREFRVTADVLDPRPETEALIAAALAEPFDRVLDLGTGSGCILLTLLAEAESATGMGVDLSPEALEVARDNALRLGVAARARLECSDWFDTVEGGFDLIVSNPPYIPTDEYRALAPGVTKWEPRLALSPGDDGLAAYRAITRGLAGHLRPGGRLLLEIGPTQAEGVSTLCREAGLALGPVLKDMDGRDRVVQARLA